MTDPMTRRHFAVPAAMLIALVCSSTVVSQTGTIAGRVLDAETGEPLPGAIVTIGGAAAGTSADEQGGFTLPGVPPGPGALNVSMIGYADFDTTLAVAAEGTLSVTVLLEPSHEEMEEVVVTGTRTARSIADVPVRVEVIPQEEVEEKLLMTPASVAMLLNESTGMRVQTTSASGNSANLRIQGLSGRYTQLLTDGIPNFGGLSAGFSITQLPPLHLRQVEVIKGATSTLYGPDAIGGVVNFLTKNPPEEGRTWSALANATTAGGFDGALFHSGRVNPAVGYTLYASGNTQGLHDVDGDGFAEIAGYDRLSVSPKVHVAFGDDVLWRLSAGFLTEGRDAGVDALTWVAEGPPPYDEAIRTRRWDAATELTVAMEEGRSLAIKAAGMQMERDAEYGGAPFDATQRFGFFDAQFVGPVGGGHTLLAGAAFNLDEFSDRTPGVDTPRSYSYHSPALFAQAEWNLAAAWTALAGTRVDFHSDYGTFITPRASVKFTPAGNVTLRAGAGTGFKAPTIFIEEAEEVGFRNVRPIGDAEAERALSGSFDVNWKTFIGSSVSLDVNAAAYLTRLENTLLADDDSLTAGGAVYLRNATGPVVARGGELSIKTGFGDLKLFLGYTFLYATRDDHGVVSEVDLNPRHSAGAVLFYEGHGSGLKVGLETYWTGTQRLGRNPYRTSSPDYFLTGLLAEQAFGGLRVFINFENIFDVRQTRWDRAYAGDLTRVGYRPVPVYAPLEGRVVNGGVRLVL